VTPLTVWPHHRRTAFRNDRSADHSFQYRGRFKRRRLRGSARADPDGYTILFNVSLFVLGKYIVAACPYDPQTDFRQIAQAGEGPLMLLANLDVPDTDFASTLEALKREPKRYFFALSSSGSAGRARHRPRLGTIARSRAR
jgi:hypothetical protein